MWQGQEFTLWFGPISMQVHAGASIWVESCQDRQRARVLEEVWWQETPQGWWRRGFDRETGRGCWAGSGTGMTESLAQVNVSCWAEQTGLASTTTESVLGSDSGRQRHL